MPQILKEPLLHFLVLGVLIFVAYDFLNTGVPADDEILVSQAQQERLVDAFSVTWKRPPTQQELQAIVREWIREEIAYREALAMGLETDDTIIRRRLRQKLEMLAEDIVSIVEPTQEDLQRFLAENQADYAEEPIYTLTQIYFSTDARGDAARQDAEQALLLLQDDRSTDPLSLGDPIPLPQRLNREGESGIAARFGREFMVALKDVETGRWQGPLRSGYGLHLVMIEDYIPGRSSTLEEVERSVKRDWNSQQRNQAIDRLYERLGAKYRISIQEAAAAEAKGS